MTNPYGQNNAANLYCILLPGATWWVNNECFEMDVQTMYGASSLIQNNGQFARLSQDWGNVGTGADVNAFAGRLGVWITSQRPAYDGTSVGSAAASAGQNLPAYRAILPLGGGSQEWLGTSATGTARSVGADGARPAMIPPPAPTQPFPVPGSGCDRAPQGRVPRAIPPVSVRLRRRSGSRRPA
jgi:hypothetical protein